MFQFQFPLLSSPALTLFLLTLLSVHIIRIYILRTRQDIHRLPGPSSAIASWIWGHELLIFQHEATQMYSTWARAFGPLFKIRAALFHPDIIIPTDHLTVHYIFANPTSYVKSPALKTTVANILGKGLVWAEGEDHAMQRKVLSGAFAPESIKGMASAISECAEKLESRLTNLVLSNSNANKSGVIVNIVEYVSGCTLDIIGRVAFGHDFKATATTASSLSPMLETPRDTALIRASWALLVNAGLTHSAFLGPLVMRAFPVVTRVPVPVPVVKAAGVLRRVVWRLGGKIVERERGESGQEGGKEKGGEGGVGNRTDILSILMRARREGKGREGLSDEQILDNISTFAMVGHETTAGALNFTLWHLAQQPDVQSRLRDEILAHGRDLGYDDIQKLEWLDAVVKEGLRLHPSSPETERVALKDDVLPLSKPILGKDGKVVKNLKVRAGQVFHIPFTTINTNPSVWGPDASAFNPARWITPGGMPPPSELPHGWSGLLTFCDGPRNCIGWRLAVFEFKVILATLIRSLEFRDTGAVVQQKISPTLQPVVDGKGGLLPLYIKLA